MGTANESADNEPTGNEPADSKPTGSEPAARDAMALALDVACPQEALALANDLSEFFAVAKVGLELFTAAGPEIVTKLVDAGFKVFVDLKLHDIPTTVHRAAAQLGRLGVSYATLHAAGGAEMLEAGVEGLRAGAVETRGIGKAGPDSTSVPAALAVTVLTSTGLTSTGLVDPTQLQQLLTERARLASQSGCAGVVCAAADIKIIDSATAKSARLLKVVPGVRPAGASHDDQARVATPGEAIADGADLLVIGRAVTASSDPAGVAALISTEVKSAMSGLINS